MNEELMVNYKKLKDPSERAGIKSIYEVFLDTHFKNNPNLSDAEKKEVAIQKARLFHEFLDSQGFMQ